MDTHVESDVRNTPHKHAKVRHWEQCANKKHVAELEGGTWFEPVKTFMGKKCKHGLDKKTCVTSEVMGPQWTTNTRKEA